MTKGLPASGKSTWAKLEVARSKGKTKRINKDDLRDMIDAGTWSKENEKNIAVTCQHNEGDISRSIYKRYVNHCYRNDMYSKNSLEQYNNKQFLFLCFINKKYLSPGGVVFACGAWSTYMSRKIESRQGIGW